MEGTLDPNDAKSVAAQLDAEIRALPVQNTPNVRAVRRRYSRQLKGPDPGFILDLVCELVAHYGYRGVAYELIEAHKGAFRSLGVKGDLLPPALAGGARELRQKHSGLQYL